MMLPSLHHLARLDTPLTTNCLLVPSVLSSPLSASSHLSILAGSYQLQSVSSTHQHDGGEDSTTTAAAVEDPSDSAAPVHFGCVSTLTFTGVSATSAAASSDVVELDGSIVRSSNRSLSPQVFPGVFDLTWIPASVVHSYCREEPWLCDETAMNADASLPLCGTSAAITKYPLVSCTDGSVRLLHPHTLATLDIFSDIHAEMLTSCTPMVMDDGATGSRGGGGLGLICTAHTGAVLLYDVAERKVLQELSGHEYDAWCSAVLPTAQAAVCEDDDGARAAAAMILTGGDDGLLKLHDARTRAPAGQMRFEAGVVSVTPVLHTSSSVRISPSVGSDGGRQDTLRSATVGATPYVLVGSYDETLSLVDVRFRKRPIAQTASLGGGVWRTSRCLFDPLRGPALSSSSALATLDTGAEVEAEEEEEGSNYLRLMKETALACGSSSSGKGSASACGWVNEKNTLFIPLMQRGAALLAYDVSAAAEEVFAKPLHLYKYFSDEMGEVGDEKDETTIDGAADLNDECLIYDTAVLSVMDGDGGCDRTGNSEGISATVATCSFYEKRTDLWRIEHLACS